MLLDIGTLTARSVIGLAFASHGAQKAFGWFDGPGPEGAGQFMDGLGFKPGKRYAILSAYTEMTGGVLLALGLGGAVGPAMISSVMLVAMATVHAKNGFYAQKGGIELGVLYAASTIALAFTGPGRYSLDSALDIDVLHDERVVALTVLGGLAGGAIALRQRVAAQE